MEMRRADEIDWKEASPCPVCGAGTVAIGNGEPFVVDGSAVFCRDHGATAIPEYTEELAAYRRWREGVAAWLEWADSQSSEG